MHVAAEDKGGLQLGQDIARVVGCEPRVAGVGAVAAEEEACGTLGVRWAAEGVVHQ